MNILLIRRGALGDTIVTLPLIRILKKKYADCRIEVIGDRNYWSVALPNYIDNITPSESKYINSLYLENSLDSEIAEYYKNFDLILGFLIDREGTIERHFREIGMDNCYFKDPFTENTKTHIVEYTTSILSDVGIDYDEDITPKIDIDKSGARYAEALIARLGSHESLISINPRTYGIKGLDIYKFIELGRWVENELKGQAIWILGPVEEENVKILESSFDRDSIVYENDIKKAAAIISATDFYVGCDTGITHLAAATGVNTISIFGPTNPDIWGSLGKNVKIINTDVLDTFDIEIVKRLIDNNINNGFNGREIIQA
ncbi:MAG: glycosyltransferase family 9 protein [Candidatus Dadabacteria bacterium]|nr:glycosyltransferase family 9 protein [Candidatus Dadabacteria bacterium]NIS07231.1 glycosyltransferase family 9 protein [Candidatus Dadabacteria bacterium]NIV40938.1 hypothetical protein [Candidatus Dadabacteria bacterium]NIX14370.1 hypothetical protein [Candidatus Dadabacteria bacterium]NIY20888.1 hypothetical protein [Candidatus Dadabacteria bacterium]